MKKSWIHKSIILNYIVPMSHIPITLQTLLLNFVFVSKVQTVFEQKNRDSITKFSSLQQLYFGFYKKLRYFSVTFLNRNRTIFCDVTKIRWHGWWRDRTMCTSYDVLPLGIPFSTCSFVANYLRQNYSSFQGRKISWKWGFNWKPHNLEIKEFF